jgi:Protein of unknown function (DUF1329)
MEGKIMQNRIRYFKLLLLIVLSCWLNIGPTCVTAGELKAGDVIKASNLDAMLSQTFESKTIESMLPENIQWMIGEKGLTITLRHSEEFPIDPRWVAATKKYSRDVKYDSETRMVTGYKAGRAFPDLSMDDPYVADKLAWDLYFMDGYPADNFQYVPNFTYLMIDGDKGLERTMRWTFLKIAMRGRLGGEPVLGDGSLYYKQLMIANYPHDVRGVGQFIVRHTNGKKDNIYAYLRSARRTRRVSGGGWFDPIGGTDQLGDEVSLLSALPCWYPKYELLGKRYILTIAHSKYEGKWWDMDNPQNPYPILDINNPPYWNFVDVWEPKEVYVLEATMPEERVFSKKRLYFDAKMFMPYYGEMYDKNGKFAKAMIFSMRPHVGEDNSWGAHGSGSVIDFERNHATVFLLGKGALRNPDLGPNDVTLGVMEAIAQGKWKAPIK